MGRYLNLSVMDASCLIWISKTQKSQFSKKPALIVIVLVSIFEKKHAAQRSKSFEAIFLSRPSNLL